jgi:Tol biopolymer transport system component/tRNA A-37 threonylcarbamoyl transferase component Bud32
MADFDALTGKLVSHYRILETLGEGGMGVVYKARDEHLDRFVAIKVLPPEKVADPERKRRFVQEAKSASALNHPNIITIFDIASDDGTDFIAMEYVPGKALNRLIPRRGLPLGEALKYAVQIADALAAAHAAGIIHRDLKPGNVMVSGAEVQGRAGLVKVLDFGLAKLVERVDNSDLELTESIRNEKGFATEEGMIVGTISYMSPEQAEGKKVDVRSDIFSFGALLYEMVTGRKAFQGDSKVSTLSAILREDPKPASQVVEGLPHELERIIGRCLRKNPERRFQTAADLKVALEELKEESDSGTLGTAPVLAKPRRWRLAGIAALVVLIGLGAAMMWFSRSKPKPEPQESLSAVPLTAHPGFEIEPTFSPDGNQVAFSWNGEKQDNQDIYIKLIGTGGPPLRLTKDPAYDYSPAWSPDGRFIAFLRRLSREKAAVLVITALGGAERKVTEIHTPLLPGPYLTWSPDNNSLVVSAIGEGQEPAALFRFSLDSGEKLKLTSPPAHVQGDTCPVFSPDGRTLAFTRMVDADLSELYSLTISGGSKPIGEPQRVPTENRNADSPAWTEDGRAIIFSSGQPGQHSLWKIHIPKSSGTSSKPELLASLGTNAYQPAISRRGNRLVYVHLIFRSSISLLAPLDRQGARTSNAPAAGEKAISLISSTRNQGSPQFSPDGKRIAFMSDRSGSYELWVCDSDGQNSEQVTSFGGPLVTNPTWSPDGERLAFDSNAGGQFDIFVVGATGGKPQRMTTDPANDGNPSWSRDGRWIYFDSARSGQQQVWKMPASGGDAIQVTRDGGFGPRESPDGKFLYYAKALSHTSLWRIPVEGGPATRVLESLSSHLNVAFVDSGIYFVPSTASGSSIQFLDLNTNRIAIVASFKGRLNQGEAGGLAISPDDKSLLYTHMDESGSEMMLVEKLGAQ